MFENLNNQSVNIAVFTLKQCADKCREECAVFVRYNALNSNLWMIFASMFLLTMFYFMNKNEEALRIAALKTGQQDTKHIQSTIEYLLIAGIVLLIIYIIIFLWSSYHQTIVM